jgi:hypothetical protein
MRSRLCITALMALTAVVVQAQASGRNMHDHANHTMAVRSPEKPQPEAQARPAIALMAWGSSPSDENQLRGMKEAGLNISGFCKATDLVHVRNAGLQCFVSDRRVNGYDWAHLPPDGKILENLQSLKQDISGNPAAFGFFLSDEPNGKTIPSIGHVAVLAQHVLPGLWPYVNLLPYMVSPRQLQADNYDTYVKTLVNRVGQPFLSYDNYSLVGGHMLDQFYTNLEIVRRIGIETHTPLWNCILAVAHFNYMEPSDATLDLQVYATLAYGGKGIEYFTYFAPEIGNYRLAAIDQFGNRTATWDSLRRINLQVQALSPTLSRLHSTGVYHFPDVPDQGHPLSESRYVRSVELTQQPIVDRPAPGRILLGEFQDESGRPYFMIVNKDLTNSFRFQIELRKPYHKLIRISSYSGKEESFGREMDWLAPGNGILFRVE